MYATVKKSLLIRYTSLDLLLTFNLSGIRKGLKFFLKIPRPIQFVTLVKQPIAKLWSR